MEKKKKSSLSPAEMAKFEELLLAKRNEILGNVSSMEDESLRKTQSDLSTMPIHMADMGTDNYELENTLGLVDSEKKILAEIDEALARIKDKTYGACENDGKPVAKERLKAIPWARYCMSCANKMEQGSSKGGRGQERMYYGRIDYDGEEEEAEGEKPVEDESY